MTGTRLSYLTLETEIRVRSTRLGWLGAQLSGAVRLEPWTISGLSHATQPARRIDYGPTAGLGDPTSLTSSI